MLTNLRSTIATLPAAMRARVRVLAQPIRIDSLVLYSVLLPSCRQRPCIRHGLCPLSWSVAFLTWHVLLRIIAELHLEQILNHLVENRVGIVLLGHLTVAIGHVGQEVSHLIQHLLLLSVFPKVLFTVLYHAFDLIKQRRLDRVVGVYASSSCRCRDACSSLALLGLVLLLWFLRLLVQLLRLLLDESSGVSFARLRLRIRLDFQTIDTNHPLLWRDLAYTDCTFLGQIDARTLCVHPFLVVREIACYDHLGSMAAM